MRLLERIRSLLAPRRRAYTARGLPTETARPGRHGSTVALSVDLLRQIANEDYVIYAIRRTLRQIIAQVEWQIVPDTDPQKAELQRWQQFEVAKRKPGGDLVPLQFESRILPEELQRQVRAALERVPRTLPYREQVRRVQTIFEAFGRLLDQEANEQVAKAEQFLRHPNDDTDAPWRALIEGVVDDLCVFDAAGIAKNWNEFGELAEVYRVPGDEIVLLRYPDGSRPRPPDPAYLWRSKGRERAKFTTDELIYLVANPQPDGYGMSPVEAAIYVILGSLEAERFSLDLLKQFNVPPVIIAASGLNEDEVEQLAARIEEEMRARKRHKIAVFGGPNIADVRILQLQGLTPSDVNMEQYLRWALYAKCMCFGLSPQDLGVVMDFHRTTAETQERLTQIRAVRGMLDLLEEHINAGIVKHPKGLACDKVRFTWKYEYSVDPVRDAQVDWGDIQRGVMTINDRRRKRGLPPVPGGDVPAVQTGMGLIPLDRLEEVALMSEEEGSSFAPEQQGLEQAGMVLGYQPSELGRVNVPAELGNIFEAMKEQRQEAAGAEGAEAGEQQGGAAQEVTARAAQRAVSMLTRSDDPVASRIAKLTAALEKGDLKRAARQAEHLRDALLKRAREAEGRPREPTGEEVARGFAEAMQRLHDMALRIVEAEDEDDLRERLGLAEQGEEGDEGEDEEA